MSRPEDNAQIAIVDFLRRAGLFVAHVKNQGKWSAHYGAMLNRMGRKKGMADLLVLTPITQALPRGAVMIECKHPPARLKDGTLSKAKVTLSDDQKDVAAELAALGVPTILARSIDDVERALSNMGVPLKGKARA